MAVNIWKRGHLNVIDPGSFPLEFVKECIDAGYACVQVMLNPKHPDTSLDQVEISYIKGIRSRGAKAWGFVWADDFSSPAMCFNFVKAWREKSLKASETEGTPCALTGFVINAEDGVEAKDSGGAWSKSFLTLFRTTPVTAKLSLALNTYNGCGGIDLAAWQKANARLYCQTFHEGNTHEWPIDSYITWARYYGYTSAAMIKPNWGTYNPFPNRADQIRTAKIAQTVGFSAWYAEGAGEPKQLLIPLLNEAKAAGVCY
jgi:hypothetical protein